MVWDVVSRLVGRQSLVLGDERVQVLTCSADERWAGQTVLAGLSNLRVPLLAGQPEASAMPDLVCLLDSLRNQLKPSTWVHPGRIVLAESFEVGGSTLNLGYTFRWLT